MRDKTPQESMAESLVVTLKLLREQEQINEQLKVQVEQLQCKLHQITTKLEEFSYIPDTMDESQLIRDLCLATPAQCLVARDAEIKAQAVEDVRIAFPVALRKMWSATEVCNYLKSYANQLHQQAKGNGV